MPVFFSSIWMASLWGGGLTVLFFAVNRLFKKKLPVAWHYYIWFAVLLRLLVPGFVTVAVPVQESAPITAMPPVIFEETVVQEPVSPVAAVLSEDLPVTDKPSPAPVTKPDAGFLLTVAAVFFMKYLWALWLSIAVLIFAVKVLSYGRCVRMLKRKNAAPAGHVLQIFETLLSRTGIRRKVSLYQNKTVRMPFVVGLFRPAVILPEKQYTEAQLHHILSHELRHVKTYDIAVKWLFEIAKCLHWFNPFVYLAARNAAFYCEALCDTSVLKNSGPDDRKAYSLTILAVIDQAIRPQTGLCIAMGGNRANLKERLQHILHDAKNKKSRALMVSATLAVVMLAVFSGILLTAKPVKTPEPVAKATEKAEPIEPPKAGETMESTITIENPLNVLIAGLDNAGLADALILARFDSETNDLSLTSIPRDTLIEGASLETPYAGESFSKAAFIPRAANDIGSLRQIMADAFGVDIDYYFKLNHRAFEKLVDAVGGVEMTVPEGGLYYEDPYQGLSIAINEGTQLLDGEKALGLVRYRAYTRGDMQRIEVQQQFMKALYQKLISGDRLVEKAAAIMDILTEDTETNMTPDEIAAYLQYLPALNAGSFETQTLPGENEFYKEQFHVYRPDKAALGALAVQ